MKRAVLCAFLLGCGGLNPPPEGAVSLIDHQVWSLSPSAEDPFDHRPDEVICKDELGWGLMMGALEVDTDDCNYGSVEQPSLVALSAGDVVELTVWHSVLEPPQGAESAEAHIAIAVDGRMIWEVTQSIPSARRLHIETFEISQDVPDGAPVLFHAHNHGANTYGFYQLIKLPKAKE